MSEQIASRLKAWLKQNKFTNKELADYMGVDPSEITRLLQTGTTRPRQAVLLYYATGGAFSYQEICPDVFCIEPRESMVSLRMKHYQELAAEDAQRMAIPEG